MALRVASSRSVEVWQLCADALAVVPAKRIRAIQTEGIPSRRRSDRFARSAFTFMELETRASSLRLTCWGHLRILRHLEATSHTGCYGWSSSCTITKEAQGTSSKTFALLMVCGAAAPCRRGVRI